MVKPMPPAELRRTLDGLELSASAAAQFLGKHRATIYRWLAGDEPVPVAETLLLRLMVDRGIAPAELG